MMYQRLKVVLFIVCVCIKILVNLLPMKKIICLQYPHSKVH